jgi:hypothetical protein
MANKAGTAATAAASGGLNELKTKAEKLEIENVGLLERIRDMQNINKEVVADLKNKISAVQKERSA